MFGILILYTRAVEIYKVETNSEQDIDFLLETDNLDRFLIGINESKTPVEAYLLKEKSNVEELLGVFDRIDSCLCKKKDLEPILLDFQRRLQSNEGELLSD